jgi:hypothetical protein
MEVGDHSKPGQAGSQFAPAFFDAPRGFGSKWTFSNVKALNQPAKLVSATADNALFHAQ